MGRMFCTVEEAAGRLGVTEPEVKDMLTEGVLREFRDGDSQFLKSAEVEAVAATRHADPPPRPAPSASAAARPAPRPAPQDPPAAGKPAQLGTPRRRATMSALAAGRPRPAKKPAAPRKPTASHAPSRSRDRQLEQVLGGEDQPLAGQPMGAIPVPSAWSGLPMEKPSLWQQFWMGVVQDRPGAILILSITLAAVLIAITACAFLLL